MIVSRVLASLAHLGLVLGLLAIGWRHFERPITGMAMAACYLLLPYTRMALVDSGQLIPAALIVGGGLLAHAPGAGRRPDRTGGRLDPRLPGTDRALVRVLPGPRGGAVHRRRRWPSSTVCAMLGHSVPGLADWAGALGARSIAEVGLLPQFEPATAGQLLGRASTRASGCRS